MEATRELFYCYVETRVIRHNEPHCLHSAFSPGRHLAHSSSFHFHRHTLYIWGTQRANAGNLESSTSKILSLFSCQLCSLGKGAILDFSLCEYGFLTRCQHSSLCEHFNNYFLLHTHLCHFLSDNLSTPILVFIQRKESIEHLKI